MFNSILNKVNTGGDCRGPVQLVNTGSDCRGPVQLGALSTAWMCIRSPMAFKASCQPVVLWSSSRTLSYEPLLVCRHV